MQLIFSSSVLNDPISQTILWIEFILLIILGFAAFRYLYKNRQKRGPLWYVLIIIPAYLVISIIIGILNLYIS